MAGEKLPAERTRTGRWKKGRSGNPKGPAPGYRGGPFAEIRDQMSARLPQILERVFQAALAGDMLAAKLILDRTIPRLRSEERPIEAPVSTIGSVIDAVASGTIDVSRACRLISTLTPIEIEERIAVLEAASEAAELGNDKPAKGQDA